MLKYSCLLLAASAISLKFQPASLVEEYNDEPVGRYSLSKREPNNEPFRPDIGRKEVRPDVYEVVSRMVDAVPLGREHLDEAPPLNPHYTLAGEYPAPDIRGPVPENAHPDVTFSSHVHDDWTH